jgi:hypothetical protein
MYRRMDGTHRPASLRALLPMEHAPWLRAQSRVPQILGVILGCVGVIFGTLFLGGMGWIPAAPHPLGGILLVLSVLAALVTLLCLVLVWEEWSSRNTYQYCPDCLSYMARGAEVCPFCGFRPDKPPRPASQRPLAC